jgi:tryptophan synthase beta subunit
MAEVKKIGRVTFRKLTDEEALREYGTSFVFVGTPPAPSPREAVTKLKTNAKKSNRNPK